MRDDVFPLWQTALTILFLLSEALYLPASPQDSWLALLAAGILAALVFALLRKLLGTVNILALDGGVGQVACFGIALIAALAALRSITRISLFFERTAFPSLPRWLTAVFVLAVAIFLGKIGRTRLTMWALPTLIAVLIPLFLSLALTMPDWQPRFLSPLLSAPYISFFKTTALYFIKLFAPLLFLFALFSGDRQGMHSLTAGILVGTLLLSVTAARNIMLLGAYTAAAVQYPTFAAAGLVTVGDFFQRAETLIAGCLTVCEIARMAVMLLVAANALRNLRLFPRFQKKV